MKKVLLFGASLLVVSSLGMVNVNASHKVHHIRHTRTVRMITINHSKKFYANRIRLMSVQLGSTKNSMINLNKGLPKMNKGKLIHLYNYLQKVYIRINHHKDIVL